MNQIKKLELCGKLGKDKIVLVDSDVFKYLNRYKWYYSCRGYASRRSYFKGKSKTIYLHKLIIDCPTGMEIDHINGNRLDNRKENLRMCTRQQNNQNRSLGRNNTSGYKGVVRHNLGKGYWKAFIKVNQKHKHLGLFKTKEEAAKAYDEAAKKYFGEFAKYNFTRRELN